MLFEILKSKIHMARVTDSNVEYDGSITIDEKLARKADISTNEKVLVSDIENGNRFETYVIYGKEGEICVNGAAANLVDVGDRLIIMSFVYIDNRNLTPKVIKVNEKNEII
ncbi:MAG: aspartate 1-decarboxylase [candidate division WOR-3 bacterium]|jgi:aspartate 1-decarboxylase